MGCRKTQKEGFEVTQIREGRGRERKKKWHEREKEVYRNREGKKKDKRWRERSK